MIDCFDKGVFTVSLDFELIWGTLDLPASTRFRTLCALERAEVFDPLLELFAEFNISATWATVGHLFLNQCAKAHPELVRSSPADKLRLSLDPGTTEAQDPIFYARQLVEKIRDCRVLQEIGSHSFTHVLLGDPSCTQATAEGELNSAVAAARELGVTLHSFVYPRNMIGHADALVRHGFTCYRAPDETWYETGKQRKWYHRAGHLTDILAAKMPPAVMPNWDANGIWAIPGSMLYTPSFGLRKYIPVKLRVARAHKGLHEAVRRRRIFHLWFHPTDLVERRQSMLDGLRQIFSTATRMRDRGQLDILTMSQLTSRLRPPVSQPALSLEAK